MRVPSIPIKLPSRKKTVIPYHLVVVGFGNLVPKLYIPVIEKYINKGIIEAYSIIDLDSQEESINQRIAHLKIRPEQVFLIPDRRKENSITYANREDFEPIFTKLRNEKENLKVIIATEVKSHEPYLRYCIENDIDTLVEKPIIAPMKDGLFNPVEIEQTMKELIEKSEQSSAKHSVMTLSRYSSIYNSIIDPVRSKLIEHNAPLTSLHIYVSSGVWNLYREYEDREDHPYKYGYGMLMHGAYHYVDLMSQLLVLNRFVYPDEEFELLVTSFGAYPSDQSDRLPKKFSEKFSDEEPEWAKQSKPKKEYGETDIVTTFALKRKSTGKVITLGSISLEQTTLSVRAWDTLPDDVYNKNGRVPHVDIELQLSTIFASHARIVKVPIKVSEHKTKVQSVARITIRANAALLKGEKFYKVRTVKNLKNDGKVKLLEHWLEGKEERSRLADHLSTMQLIQAIALSLREPGCAVKV